MVTQMKRKSRTEIERIQSLRLIATGEILVIYLVHGYLIFNSWRLLTRRQLGMAL